MGEAFLAKSLLESAGIECFLADDNMVRLDWFYSNLIGGIKLNVNREDRDEAEGVLSQPIPDGFEVDGVGEYRQPRCPKCQSVDITFQAMNKGIGLTTAWAVGLPLPIPENSWKCNSCGVKWQEVDEPEK